MQILQHDKASVCPNVLVFSLMGKDKFVLPLAEMYVPYMSLLNWGCRVPLATIERFCIPSVLSCVVQSTALIFYIGLGCSLLHAVK